MTMFIDQEWKNEKRDIPIPEPDNDSEPIYKNPYFMAGAGFFFLLIMAFAIGVTYFYKPSISFYSPPSESKQPAVDRTDSTSTPVYGLSTDNGGEAGGNKGKIDFNNFKAENLRFGQFYKNDLAGFEISGYDLALPINIKIDVQNYYDFSRKINLGPIIDELNQSGFAIVENQLGAESGDFFSTERKIKDQGLPMVLTTDMLWYFHQNSLKTVFKEIEKNVFFEYVWDVNKRLYDISLARYKNRLSEIGPVNDIALEAERQETAFLAVALQLLRPKSEQIVWDKNFVDKNMFSAQESDFYHFDMQPDIERDVRAEVNKIEKAEGEAFSTVMLYQLDYGRFIVPDNYAHNAKLKNYFLAIEWLKNQFPLYYKDKECQDCRLDYNDWLINFMAANYLAKDLGDNQELKNKWAVIYKFIAFFEGLRSELTYLDYYNYLKQKQGGDYDPASVFLENNSGQLDQLGDMQNIFGRQNFLPIEGGLDRDEKANRPEIGMRLLQTHFWPDHYIFDELSGPELAPIISQAEYRRITRCNSKAGDMRCSAFGEDILSLLDYPPQNDQYFEENTKYRNYQERVDGIKDQFGKFDANNWNSNTYWLNFDLARTFIDFYQANSQRLSLPAASWQRKTQNTILGAWANLNLPNDELVNFESENEAGLGQFSKCNEMNFIEANPQFYADLLARGEMLFEVINILPIDEKTNAAAIAIKELNNKFRQVLDISVRELKGEALLENDCNFIDDFATSLAVERAGEKNFSIPSRWNKGIKQSIKGTKLLILVYSRNDRKYLAVGPIFRYQEGK